MLAEGWTNAKAAVRKGHSVDGSPLNILNIIPSLNPAEGGPAEGLRQHCMATQDICGRDVVCLDDPAADYLTDFPATVHALGQPVSWPGLMKHYRFSPALIPWLRKNIANYDAIITHGLWNYASLAASIVLPNGITPYYSFTHGMMDPWFKRQYPLKHIAKQAFWVAAEGRLLSRARRVLFTAEEEASLAKGMFWGHGFEGCVVGYGTKAPPSVSLEDVRTFRAMCPTLGNRPYMLYLSRIHEKKGCDLLLQAFAGSIDLLGRMDLVIAGPGNADYIQFLKTMSIDLGIYDRIHWPGMLKGSAKWGAYSGSEVFVLPSHQENFGIVVAEALALGKPVITTNKVNIWREIEASRSGLICDDTLVGVRSAIDEFLQLDDGERRSMSVSAKSLFRDQFDVNVVAPALVRLIQSDVAHAR